MNQPTSVVSRFDGSFSWRVDGRFSHAAPVFPVRRFVFGVTRHVPCRPKSKSVQIEPEVAEPIHDASILKSFPGVRCRRYENQQRFIFRRAGRSPRGSPVPPALEVVCRLLIWMAEGNSLDERGVRATVALWCVRPDLIGETTSEEIGHGAGRSKQAVHQLADSFRETTGPAP